MVFRVSPHRHSQSLSRDVPSTIRLPSAIVPENDDEKDDIEKSTKKEIEEDLNIFCRRRLKSCRAFFLPFWCSQKSFFFSRARKAARRVPILCVALCVRQKMRDRFFFAEKKRREEKKKIKKKKKKSSKETVQKSSHQIALSSQIFRHSFPSSGKIGSPHLFVTTTNDTRRSKSTHDIYNKKELSIISRSNKMMLMCVNRCVIHFSTFR